MMMMIGFVHNDHTQEHIHIALRFFDADNIQAVWKLLYSAQGYQVKVFYFSLVVRDDTVSATGVEVV